jgi:2-amino-4-hydroxy-6-hydroxymethyldihydropteridine diphosphokinase
LREMTPPAFPATMGTSMARIYLSLGSNMGDRAANLGRAIKELGKRGVRVKRRSSLYETEPVEFREQAWFLNAAAEAETELGPADLLAAALAVEQEMGRERRVPRGPRVIDIDILLYGDEAIDSAELKIPHPRMAERRFVLVPLAEIAPEAMHPVAKKSVRELLAETTDRSEVRRIAGGKRPDRSQKAS